MNNQDRRALRFYKDDRSTMQEWNEKADKAIQDIGTSNINKKA